MSITITIEFDDEEHEKLVRLACYRRMSIQECLRSFARNCQPGGSGWEHPSKSSTKPVKG